jgi:predicted nucleic acid-binding protein
MMRTVFADTNVLIDFLINREPFFDSAVAIFELAELNKIKVCVSAQSIGNIYYIMRKCGMRHTDIMHKLESLFLLVTVLPVTDMVLKQAMRSPFVDFEDAIQYYSALQDENCQVIITRDIKGFRFSEKPVVRPDDFLGMV